MAISEYTKVYIEARKWDERLDKIASRNIQELQERSKILNGSRTRITLLSLESSAKIEKKYKEIYGENWRERLSAKEVNQIEEQINAEKRIALREIEDNTLRSSPYNTAKAKKLSRR